MPSHDEVLIVGAGVIGLMCALTLLRDGRQVRVIDREHPGAGASHGNCGTITPSHAAPLAMPGTLSRALRWMWQADAPLYVKPRLDPALAAWLWRFARRCNPADAAKAMQARARILLDSRRRLEDWIRDEQLDCNFVASGSWYVFQDPADFENEQILAPRLAELGIASKLIDREQALSEEPLLRDALVGVVEYTGDAHLRPDRLVAALASRVIALGGTIESDCEAGQVSVDRGGAVVETTRGLRRADWLVVAAGAWSPGLLRSMGLRIPLQPGKGYSMTWSRPDQVPGRPLVLHESSVCVTSWQDGYRLGSTMEFSGYDARLNRTRLDALVRGADRYLHRSNGGELQEEWYGWRPMMPDDLPLIGPVPNRPRTLFAGGHGMLGVSMAATTGRLIADQIADRTPCIDAREFDPARYA